MRYKSKRFKFHADGVRAQAGEIRAEDINDARFQVEKRLGYKRPLEWRVEGTRMVAQPHGTRVVVYRLWSDGRGGMSEDGQPPPAERRGQEQGRRRARGHRRA